MEKDSKIREATALTTSDTASCITQVKEKMVNQKGSKILIQVMLPSSPLFPIPLHVFGCICFTRDLGPSRDKLSPRAIKFIFLGYKYFCPSTRKTIKSIVVTFSENVPFFDSTISEIIPLFPSVLESAIPIPIDDCIQPPQDVTIEKLLQVYRHRPKGVRKGTHLYLILYPLIPYLTVIARCSFVSLLETSHRFEMEALLDRGTWELCDLPLGAGVVGCRLVYTINCKANGSIDIHRARLVTKETPRLMELMSLRPFPLLLACPLFIYWFFLQ
ncbi:uncharacterized protein [Aristolochia californica]|uniref:uncharacterized protein n=1 Tax=Aristolochia californica TaxID=171875 RepID=UPI0035E14913